MDTVLELKVVMRLYHAHQQRSHMAISQAYLCDPVVQEHCSMTVTLTNRLQQFQDEFLLPDFSLPT